jgi:hypothetical protein
MFLGGGFARCEKRIYLRRFGIPCVSHLHWSIEKYTYGRFGLSCYIYFENSLITLLETEGGFIKLYRNVGIFNNVQSAML